MARRQSILGQIIEGQMQSARDREKAEEARYQAKLKQYYKDLDRRNREAEAAHQRAEAEQLRRQRAAARQAEKDASEKAKEDRRIRLEQRQAEADQQTEAVTTRRKDLNRILLDRRRDLVVVAAEAERTFTTEGADAFVARIQRALARSRHPAGVAGSQPRSAVLRPPSFSWSMNSRGGT